MKPYPVDRLCPKCHKDITNYLFPEKKDEILCTNCKYKMVKPFPKRCPKCNNPLPEIQDDNAKPTPKQFETKKELASDKFKGIRVKQRDDMFSFEDDKIFLKGDIEYVKFCGVVSKNRTPLFYTKEELKFFLELSNNLDFIATSILRGVLDKMLLIGENNLEEKCQFYEKDKVIYVVYGVFPDKKGKWILEQMAKYYGELILNKDIDNLTPIEKKDINTKFEGAIWFIFKEYLQLKEVFTDQDISYLEDWIRIDYLGLSSMSIGVISLLLDDKDKLKVELPGKYEDPAEEKEMKESLLTAKIEAIAANTLGNTGAYPRWIAVKLGFQQYRFLTFKKLQNDYFLSLLSEGNLKKIPLVEEKVIPILLHVIDKPFTGDLKPFNRLKATLKDMFLNEVMCPSCKSKIKKPFPKEHVCPNCHNNLPSYDDLERKFY